MPTAMITGASAGLGRAIAAVLAARNWDIVITARGTSALTDTARSLSSVGSGQIRLIAGDVADPLHRADLVREIDRTGQLDLLVNNASALGPTPLRSLADWRPAELEDLIAVNLTAPFALTAALLPALAAARGVVLGISSDAAVEHYPGWGGYGASKAALDHLILTFAAENPDIDCYAVDPGDMRTAMQQAAFPDEDINDRRPPEEVVPALLDLIATRLASGRYRVVGSAAVPDFPPLAAGRPVGVDQPVGL